MITIRTTSQSPTAMPAFACARRMSAPVTGPAASVEGRHEVADTAYIAGVRVPAFLKDLTLGVRAWSPPV